MRRDEPLTALPLSVLFSDEADDSGVIGPSDVPPSFFGLDSYASVDQPAPRVARRSAIQVPVVKRGRDLIAGKLGSLPVKLYGPDNEVVPWSLFDQPETGIAPMVTFTRTFEDLFFEGTAWWCVVQTGWHTYPVQVIRLDPGVDVQRQARAVITKMGHHGTHTSWDPDFDLIRFDSPNDPVLVAAARAIRTCLRLDAAAGRYAEGNQPLDYFTPAEGADPEQPAVDAALDQWETARRLRTTGYVPRDLAYHTAGWNPEQLQLADQRQHAKLEVATAMGINPEDVGIAITSRTYFNAFDRKQANTVDTLRGYQRAFEERLSMNDITPRGYTVRLDFTDLLKSDDLTRFQAYKAGLDVGVYADQDEVRAAEGRPPLPANRRKPALAPAPAPAQETDHAAQ